ncbi:CRT (chloroquine-resistance transporter)-like transporter 2 [Rhynchospora pubera]|uniref:CRT (Chloroquine-resistance transporter)-like transporter 2 n=1 Tax=Rhynchospora pubera TaxID=906938 RepID=A0AAV8HVX4_9POAL|nr:CRT (chloroquine-resistance transporter)-like transporter 2 [Rhynchospora pubera]KAJ4819608.1 CRT (chloroquine-resistance transporter)-like transporter 2 [Rhynchospora pubera]
MELFSTSLSFCRVQSPPNPKLFHLRAISARNTSIVTSSVKLSHLRPTSNVARVNGIGLGIRTLPGREWCDGSKSMAVSGLARASKREDGLPESLGGGILVGSSLTVMLAVMNRVLYKLALVPLKNYPFFLAQITTFGYVAVYFTVLYLRYRSGIVTREMLALPKSRFAAIGFLEAIGVASGMASAAMLPGPAIPILNQSFLVWQLVFSVLILGRKYSSNQILGCLLVTAGVIIAVASGSGGGQVMSQVELLWPALMIASAAFQSGASILKEFVFIDGAARLKGKSPDIFVVNSFGSGFQALFVFLLLPILSNLRGIPFSELPAYLKSGAGCFLNFGGSLVDCRGAPLLPLLFIATNMAFNISLLNLVKMTSALVASLAATLAVPISIYVLSLPLPYLLHGTSLNTSFIIGSAILVLGLILYNLPKPKDELKI